MRLSAFRSIPRYDALVVGARCAGAATAMLLARQGLKVLAVDRQPEGSDTLSTHALMRPAAMLLARWGVLGELFALGTPPLRRTTFHFAAGLASGSGSGGERLEVPIKPGHGVDALAAPRRTRLDAALAAQARRAGVDLRFGVSLVAAVRDARGRVTGAVLGQPDGTRAEVACDLLVGADGRASQVAAAVGAPVLRQARHSSVLLYGYHRGLGRDAYHWHYAPGASAGVIPTDDGEACVYAATSEARMRGGFGVDPRAAYRDLLAEAAPELGPRALPGGGRLRAFWGAKGFLRQAHGPGWALVGDAGQFTDPLTSHGISAALRDAHLLASRLGEAGHAGLESFQAERDALSRDLFEVSDRVASFAWDTGELRGLLERLSAAMKAEVQALGPEPLAGLPAAAA